jgi:hypothetical protein
MSEKPTPKDAARLLYNLRRSQETGRHQAVSGASLDPQMALLRAWQSERLSKTYADLLADSRYGPACRFFLSDIYAPRDFTQRDHDIERMHSFMLKFIPARILHPLAVAIELNTLTKGLDMALLEILVNQLGLTDNLTPQMYAEGYRRCKNYEQRVDQIELVMEVGQEIDRLAHLPLVGASLRLARGPAYRAGWYELQDFLERGFAAFKHMRGAKKFLYLTKQREKQILDRIYAGEPDPFEV